VQALTSAPGEGSGHSLQAAACTEVSFVTSSVYVEASDIRRALTVGALVLPLRQVPTVTAETRSSPLGCGLQVDCRALPAPAAVQTAVPCSDCCAMPFLPALITELLVALAPEAPFKSPMVAAGNTHASSRPTRCRLLAGLAALPSGFPGSGNTPVHLGRAPSHESYHHHSCLSCRLGSEILSAVLHLHIC